MPYRDLATQRKYQRDWARRRREELLAGRPCMRCGATENLQLHHLVKGEKTSHRITTWAKSRADAEAAKCVVLCQKCHSDLHADERKPRCGSTSAYRRGCRCDDCRSAHREAARAARGIGLGTDRGKNVPKSEDPHRQTPHIEHLGGALDEALKQAKDLERDNV